MSGSTTSTQTGAASSGAITNDNTGVSVKTITKARITAPSGAFIWEGRFRVPRGTNGVLVQQITITSSYINSAGRVINRTETYWEAWNVSNGIVTPNSGSVNDQFEGVGLTNAHLVFGTITIAAELQFYRNATYDWFGELSPKGAPKAGDLYSSEILPDKWSSDGALKPAKHLAPCFLT